MRKGTPLRSLARRGCLLAFGAAALVAACNWDPSRPFDRESPQVKEALQSYDAGDAGSAAALLEGYLATGACKEGSIGTPDRVRERSNGSFDLGLALFKIAEAYGHRFGEEEIDGGLVDPNGKAVRQAQVECALRVVRAIAEDASQPLPLRARARYLEGNLLFLSADYKGAVTAYDSALELAPGMADGGPIGASAEAGIAYAPDPLGRDAAWNRAVALRRIEDKKDAGQPDSGQGDGGGDNNDNKDGGNNDQNKDAGNNDNKDAGGKDDKDKNKDRDAGSENNKPKPPKTEPDAGAPPPPSRQSQDDRILDQLENAPTVQQQAAKHHGHTTPGMVDK
jgi:hypothetical protein